MYLILYYLDFFLLFVFGGYVTSMADTFKQKVFNFAFVTIGGIGLYFCFPIGITLWFFLSITLGFVVGIAFDFLQRYLLKRKNK